MKKIKIIAFAFCIGLSCLNIANMLPGKNSAISLMGLIKFTDANAEVLDPINVRFWGLPDVRTCTYWTHQYTGEIIISLTNPGGSGSTTWVEHVGTKTLCDNWTNDPCDYIACH